MQQQQQWAREPKDTEPKDISNDKGIERLEKMDQNDKAKGKAKIEIEVDKDKK